MNIRVENNTQNMTLFRTTLRISFYIEREKTIATIDSKTSTGDIYLLLVSVLIQPQFHSLFLQTRHKTIFHKVMPLYFAGMVYNINSIFVLRPERARVFEGHVVSSTLPRLQLQSTNS